MMYLTRYLPLFGACLLCLVGQVHADPQWQLLKDKNGIQVYAYKPENSGIITVKTTTVIHAPLARVQQLIERIDLRTEWIPRLKQARILHTIDSEQGIEYALFAAPWPASDRDFVYRMTRQVNTAKKQVIAMQSTLHNKMPEHASAIRAELIESVYTLNALDDGHTRGELVFRADLKGWLPDWIINIVQRALPYLMLKNLTEKAEADPDQPIRHQDEKTQGKIRKGNNKGATPNVLPLQKNS